MDEARKSRIVEKLDDFEKVIACCMEAVSSLSSNLGPLLMDESPRTVTSEDREAPTGSLVSLRLEKLSDSVKKITILVEETAERLDL